MDDASHDEKITLLKYYLEQSVNPDDDPDIPDDVIKAFVTKVVVHESSFDWYLRFSPDKTPHSLGVDGRRKNTAKISSLCSPQHRQLLTKVGKSNFVKVQEFSIDLSEAKAYLYAYSTRHRIHKWEDLNISVFI